MKRLLDWLVPDDALSTIGRTCGAFMDGLLAPPTFTTETWIVDGRRVLVPVLGPALTVTESMRPVFVQWATHR